MATPDGDEWIEAGGLVPGPPEDQTSAYRSELAGQVGAAVSFIVAIDINVQDNTTLTTSCDGISALLRQVGKVPDRIHCSTKHVDLVSALADFWHLVFETKVARILKLPQSNIIYEGPRGIDKDNTVELFLGGRLVAECTISYVGCAGDGNTIKWGEMTVRPGKATVTVDKVHVPTACPPHSFKARSSEEQSWKKQERTLADLIGNEILVNTSDLVIRPNLDVASSNTENAEECSLLQKSDPPSESDDESSGDGSEKDAESSEIETEDDPFLIFLEDLLEEKVDENNLRSRKQKEDLFHWFKNLPLRKLEPSRHIIMRFIFDDDDFRNIETYLQLKKGFSKEDLEYDNKLMRHFYHNKEWWRGHCRMYVPKALQHAMRVKQVVAAMKTDEYLSSLLTEEVLTAYFQNFEGAILRGEFEEQKDVLLFIKVGEDKNGLSFYYRLRGTGRTENLHQKMKMAIGPWGVGARTGHMLLVLTCFRNNENSKVRRCGAYDFGHCELHLIDRIQNRLKDVFNILVWPRHNKNMSYFQGKKNYVSVGIATML